MKNRLNNIDVLRGVAIILVFIYHFYGTIYARDSLPWLGDWPDWRVFEWRSFHVLYFLRLGSGGVILFFVLSGFCIHYSYLRKTNTGLRQTTLEFYLHRFFRIYPPYLLAVLVFLLVNPAVSQGNIIAHVAFIHNLFDKKDIFFGINPSFWSLPVEFHLYLIYPLFLCIRRRCGITSALGATLLATVVFNYALPDVPCLNLKGLPFAYWFYWSIGAYVAEMWFSTGSRAFRFHRPMILMLATLYVLSNYYRPVAEHSWMLGALLSAYVVDAILHRSPAVEASVWLRSVSGVGVVSYSLYLWHQPLLGRISELLLVLLGLPRTPVIMIGLCLPVAFFVMVTISRYTYRAIELQSIDFGQKLLLKWPLNRSRYDSRRGTR